jgi:hypothetical protein
MTEDNEYRDFLNKFNTLSKSEINKLEARVNDNMKSPLEVMVFDYLLDNIMTGIRTNFPSFYEIMNNAIQENIKLFGDKVISQSITVEKLSAITMLDIIPQISKELLIYIMIASVSSTKDKYLVKTLLNDVLSEFVLRRCNEHFSNL